MHEKIDQMQGKSLSQLGSDYELPHVQVVCREMFSISMATSYFPQRAKVMKFKKCSETARNAGF